MATFEEVVGNCGIDQWANNLVHDLLNAEGMVLLDWQHKTDSDMDLIVEALWRAGGLITNPLRASVAAGKNTYHKAFAAAIIAQESSRRSKTSRPNYHHSIHHILRCLHNP